MERAGSRPPLQLLQSKRGTPVQILGSTVAGRKGGLPLVHHGLTTDMGNMPGPWRLFRVGDSQRRTQVSIPRISPTSDHPIRLDLTRCPIRMEDLVAHQAADLAEAANPLVVAVTPRVAGSIREKVHRPEEVHQAEDQEAVPAADPEAAAEDGRHQDGLARPAALAREARVNLVRTVARIHASANPGNRVRRRAAKAGGGTEKGATESRTLPPGQPMRRAGWHGHPSSACRKLWVRLSRRRRQTGISRPGPGCTSGCDHALSFRKTSTTSPTGCGNWSLSNGSGRCAGPQSVRPR